MFRTGRIVLGLLGAVLLLAAGAAVWLATIDLRPLVERYATDATGRPVAIGALRIGWRSPLSLELDDLRIANTASGSDPDMLRVAHLSALIDLSPLLRGVVRFEKLVLEQPTLLLERTASGAVNWHFPAGGAGPRFLALIPKNRAEFPTLIDLALRDGAMIYRAAGRRDLRIAFRRLAIGATGDDQPARLEVDGAYNDTAVRLTGTTASFAALRDKAVPFGVAITLATASGTLDFKGTMVEPLDLDGVDGRLRIDVPKLVDLLKVFGADMPGDVPVSIAGTVTTQGVDWRLAAATGTLAHDDFTGALDLAEGRAGQPDDITIALDFPRLDLAPLVGSGAAAAPKPDIFTLHLERNPGATLEARVAAKQLIYGRLRAADVAVDGRFASGELLIRAASFALAGGRVALSGRVQASDAGNALIAEAALSSADGAQIAGLAGLPAGEIAGKLDARVSLAMTGGTLTAALKTSQGQGVVAMTQGRIARDLLEQASTDLRNLFRKGEGVVPVTCLLGVMDLRNGVATIAPLRLRTPDTTLVGGGRVDLAAQRLDLTIGAEGGSSSIFALRVPLRVTGSLDRPTILPAIGASVPRLDGPRTLPPALAQLAEPNPCRR